MLSTMSTLVATFEGWRVTLISGLCPAVSVTSWLFGSIPALCTAKRYRPGVSSLATKVPSSADSTLIVRPDVTSLISTDAFTTAAFVASTTRPLRTVVGTCAQTQALKMSAQTAPHRLGNVMSISVPLVSRRCFAKSLLRTALSNIRLFQSDICRKLHKSFTVRQRLCACSISTIAICVQEELGFLSR